jgi:hypothetical protein
VPRTAFPKSLISATAGPAGGGDLAAHRQPQPHFPVEFARAGSQIARRAGNGPRGTYFYLYIERALPQLTPLERQLLGRRRLVNVLRQHGIATWRTLEQKISDAGPGGMRIDPHILTPARRGLERDGIIIRPPAAVGIWFAMHDTPAATVTARLAAQLPVYRSLQRDRFKIRLGQTLEIAIYRALLAQSALPDFLGSFLDLAEHDDRTPYAKEEPPRRLGARSIGGDRGLDFLVRHPTAGWAGIEAKNIREWMYPDRSEIIELLSKSVALDVVPVLIARRIHFSTFAVFYPCGVILHQTYNQLFPEADTALANNRAKHRENLGFHDIRSGNAPDARLTDFIARNLPAALPAARERFDEYKDLLDEFANGPMDYPEFAARVRRRSEGRNEDHDWEQP